MDEAIEEALRAGRGVLAIGQHPALAWRVRRARERGELVAVLRGRYATPAAAASFAVRVLASGGSFTCSSIGAATMGP